MPIRNITRCATLPGSAAPHAAPIYVDSDDDILKMVPAGSGTTEIQIVDNAKAQTIAGIKTFSSAPVMSGASITGATIPLASLVGGATPAISGASIQAGTIPASALVAGAGISALVAAGLGNSLNYVKTDAKTETVVAANATKTRGVIVILTVTEAYATAGGTQPTIKVGEDDTIEKGIAAATVASATLGTVFCSGFLNLATKKIITTTTAAVGAATGACSVTVLDFPSS